MRTADHGSVASIAARGGAVSVVMLWPVLLLLGVQSALFLFLTTGMFRLSIYLELQFAASVVAAACWFACAGAVNSAADRCVGALQLFAWSTLGGPFGAAVAAALALRAAARPRPDRDARADATLSRVEDLHRALLDRRLRLDSAHAIRPLLDVILEGTQHEKFDALRLIGKRYAPSAATALRCAAEDEDASVRVLAATITAQQHNVFIKRIGARQAAAQAAPDAAYGWSELAQAHLDYARSGLLDASRADAELGQAHTHFARAEALAGDAADPPCREPSHAA